MRKLNLVFLMGVVMALLVLSGATYLVHGRQVERNASALLDRARKAEEQGEGSKASEALRHYLTLRPADGETWRWYARVLDEVTADSRRRDQVYLVYEEALRYNSGDPALERRCVDLALELRPERTADAKRHLKVLLTLPPEKLKKDPEASNATRELAELEELEGKCFLLESDFEAAANAYNDASSYDPTRLACYVQRARLYRNELRKDPKDADDEIERMVANNPESGPAHLYRFRYLSEFRPPAADSDLKKALDLAPDDPEVLLTAALVAEQKKDPAAARIYLEKGLKLHSQNADIPMAIARLELGAQHPDRAEAVLRQAYQAKPSADLAFLLAETLIMEDKIEGEDSASVFMNFLADRGYRETLVRYLEARIEVQKKRWDKAISKIESARAVLKADPQVSTQLNLMLAECYTHLGWDEQRLVALRNAGEGQAGSEAARLALARSLTESGKLDEALPILLPLADRQPELRLDIVRVMIEKTLRQPGNQRNWREVEKRWDEARKAQPDATEALNLLHADLLAAEEKWDEARSLLISAQSKNPKFLPYRLTLARLAQRDRQGPVALQILDQAEKDLGQSLDIRLARLDYWVQRGGEEAKAAVAKLAETRNQIPAAERPAFLDQLAVAEIRLGEPALARQYWRELSGIQPDNIRILMGRLDLALAANDQAETRELVESIRKGEGEQGTTWRFAQALNLIDRARRGDSTTLQAARTLASEVAARRADWWGASLLNAQIAELQNQPEQALTGYMEAVKLGNGQPAVIRRLVGLLYQRNQFDEIDRLAQLLHSRDIALPELTVVNAINALRQRDYNHGIALVRQVFSDTSTSFADHLSLGRFYFTAGRLDEAGKYFQRAVELGPGIPETWLTYIQYLVQTKHLDQAKIAIELARKAFPTDRTTLARCLMMVGETTESETLIQSALKEKPGAPTALRVAASFYLERGRTEEAGKYLDALAAPAPGATPDDLVWARRTRASVLIGTGRLVDSDLALSLLDRNLEEKPDSVEDRRVKALILARRPGRRGEAIKILEPMAGANLLAPNDRFVLAQAYLGEGQERKYQGEMLKIIDREVKEPQHLAHYVSYLISRNQLDTADGLLAELKKIEPRGLSALQLEAALLKASRKDPQLLALLEAWGREVPDQIGVVADLLNRYGFPKEAEQAYKAYVARDPKQPERILALAAFLAQQGRTSESFTILSRASSTCAPEQVAVAALALYVAPSADDVQKSRVKAWLEEAIQKRPEAGSLVPKLGTILYKECRYEEAESIFRKVLARDPENAECLNHLAWMLAMREPSKPEEALELINRAIELHGHLPSLVDTRAVVFIRSGRFDEALQDLRFARESNPMDPGYPLHLAWALHYSGNTDAARKEFQEAERLGLREKVRDPLSGGFIDMLRHDLSGHEPAPTEQAVKRTVSPL